ncbi:hypothetical protein [Rhizobacter sp. P5_C2]
MRWLWGAIGMLALGLQSADVASAEGLPADTEGFRALVEVRIPIGTQLDVGKSSLEALGLKCAPFESYDAEAKTARISLLCSRTEGWLVAKSWLVDVQHKDGRVSSIYAFVALTGS